MPIKAIFFDVGETVVDETNTWNGWADWLNIPRFTFHATLGAVIAQGRHQLEIFRIFAPERKWPELLAQREAEQPDFGFTADDLYPDAQPTLQALQAAGFRIGIAGNQPPRAARILESSTLPYEWLLISELAGVEKPSTAFFARLVELTSLSPEEIAYVGDRVDNDVLPALEAGLIAVHLRRGPWGYIQAQAPAVRRAHLRIDTLAELPQRLSEI
ncbi:MAG: HAD family hydrolase [Candidatus Dormibacteraceae bacterium]